MRGTAGWVVLFMVACSGGASHPKMPRTHHADAEDGIVGGRSSRGTVVGTYSIFQPLGCVDGAGRYLPPPDSQLKLVSIAHPDRPAEAPITVVQPGLDRYPSEIENAYSEDGERMWFAYRPDGAGYQLVLRLDWSKRDGRTELLLHPPGSYTFEVTGNQYRVRATKPTRCQLAVLWVGKEFHPAFTPPTQSELTDRIAEYEAALTAPDEHDEEHEQAWHHAFEGVNVYHIGEYENAVVLLEEAFAILRTPHLALWSARALVRAGRIEEARARYTEAADLPVTRGAPNVQRRAMELAATELASLTASKP